MLDKEASIRAVTRIVQRRRVVQMDELFRILQTRSRMSVFRRLRNIGYQSSYTHAGGYYTLADIPTFDEDGLWFHQGVGFSRSGTLKSTVVDVVERSGSGMMHGELRDLLRVRVQNTLVAVVREGLIAREQLERWYVYVSSDRERATSQLASRRELLERARQQRPLLPATVVEVLVEVIEAGGVVVEPRVTVAGLAARDIDVSIEQVERVYREHGLVPGKKTR